MRKHNFIDKHPIGGSILIGFFMMVLRELISTVFMAPHALIFGMPSELMKLIYMVISAIIVFLLYKWWFSPEFEGALKGGDVIGGLKNSWPFIAYWVINGIVLFVAGALTLKPLNMSTVTVSVTAGIVEEMAFRHGMISTMLRNRNQKDQILKCCLISSVVFGLIHLANVVQGADPIATLLQAVTATCLGIFFAAIYVNCGNLLPCMIVHALHDIYAISIDATVSEQGVITGMNNLTDIADAILCIALAAYAIYRYLKKDKNLEQIVSLWNHKWGKDSIQAIKQ